jgi:hypothetical protein
MLPQGMSFPPAPNQDGAPPETANDADAFMLTLAERCSTHRAPRVPLGHGAPSW